MQQTHVITGTVSDTRATPPSGKLAMWWFLASEMVTFGGLLGSFVVFRLAHPAWAEEAHHLSVLIAMLNTLVLLTSSLTVVLAFAAVDQGDMYKTRTWLLLTVLGGLVFLGIKACEWRLEIGAGRVPGAGSFWSFYFAMAGLHGLHVLAGLVALYYMHLRFERLLICTLVLIPLLFFILLLLVLFADLTHH